jgi:SNF2 family DNA or RNA helicase
MRRNGKYLDLPQPHCEEISIELKGEERIAYNTILKKCARDIDELVSTQAKTKKYTILFAAIIKLRRLCNHGTLSLERGSLSATLTSAADDEADCDFAVAAMRISLRYSTRMRFAQSVVKVCLERHEVPNQRILVQDAAHSLRHGLAI